MRGCASTSQRRRKQRMEARNVEPTVTAIEAARQVLAQRKISKKINYAVFDGLFEHDQSGSAAATAAAAAAAAALKRE